MVSILPALVSVLFLGLGAYVLASRGSTPITRAFFVLCVLTFCWQFTWSVLFQMEDEMRALRLARFGYFLILILPTTLYHFVVELTRHSEEVRWVRASYVIAIVLGAVTVWSDQLVAGLYRYSFGFYPRAGQLLWLHIAQTAAVVLRALLVLYRAQMVAPASEKLRLRYCMASIAIYGMAAIDYACNYGLAIYPPGMFFIALALCIIGQAIARHNLMANPIQLAATLAHELRTPLATLRLQARILERGMPVLLGAYEQALASGHVARPLQRDQLEYLRGLGELIEAEVSRSNLIAEMVLASSGNAVADQATFSTQAVRDCVNEAVESYPYAGQARERVRVGRQEDFNFHGSDALLVLVLYNLLKNALRATHAGGEVELAYFSDAGGNCLQVADSGCGIPPHVLPHVFDPYFTTREGNAGLGLAFCRRAISTLGGTIACSLEGRTVFTIRLPGPAV